ncbi:MAG TPA: nitroreductase family protein [Thermoguttaceae bacterium]|nr:nitroreductase family protein [Thermoguttaceae bacterium]
MTETGEHPNPTLDLLMGRASCRDFSRRRIPPEVLQKILEAGTHAATGGNLQPYSIIKTEKEETKQRLAELCGRQYFMASAPVMLLFCIDWHRLRRWAELEVAPYTSASSFRNFWISFQDTIICAQSICTAADSLGVGSVYIGMVLECLTELRDMFRLPDAVFPVVLLCLGYPAEELDPARKLAVEAVVHDEQYREMDDRELLEAFAEKYRGRELKITPERLETIARVCRDVHGEPFASRCLKRIEDNGHVNMAQYYFALHYHANRMPLGNETFLERMEEFGFDWFKQYRPPQEDV